MHTHGSVMVERERKRSRVWGFIMPEISNNTARDVRDRSKNAREPNLDAKLSLNMSLFLEKMFLIIHRCVPILRLLDCALFIGRLIIFFNVFFATEDSF